MQCITILLSRLEDTSRDDTDTYKVQQILHVQTETRHQYYRILVSSYL